MGELRGLDNTPQELLQTLHMARTYIRGSGLDPETMQTHDDRLISLIHAAEREQADRRLTTYLVGGPARVGILYPLPVDVAEGPLLLYLHKACERGGVLRTAGTFLDDLYRLRTWNDGRPQHAFDGRLIYDHIPEPDRKLDGEHG